MQDERQKELFENFTQERQDGGLLGRARRQFTISLGWEHISLLLIGLLLTFLLTFSLGVERGRQIAANERVLVKDPGTQLYYVGPFKAKAQAERALHSR